MTDLQRLGILIYILVIIQNVATLTIFIVRVKPSPARRSLAVSQLSIILWLVLGILEILFQRTIYFPIIVRIIIVNLYFIGPLWLLCTLDILDIYPRHRRLIRWLVLSPALVSALPSISDRLLPFAIRRIENMQMVTDWGIVLYINAGLLFVYVLISAILIFLRTRRDRLNAFVRGILVLSMFVPVLTILLNHYQLIPDAGMNSVPVTLALFTAIVALAILRYEMIDIRPAASFAVFRHIHDGVIIIDRHGRIIDRNPSFERLLGEHMNTKNEQHLEGFLDLLGQSCADDTIRESIREALKYGKPQSLDTAIRLPRSNGATAELQCTVLPLSDERDRLIGHIISFSDVTDLRRVTINNERMRLAGDLHDSIGHSLNSISLNVEYVLNQKPLDERASQMLGIAYERSQQALIDLRRIVDELKPIELNYDGLLKTLEQMSSRYNHLPIDITLTFEGVDEHLIRQTQVGEAVYFICMEAVNNAIRHGKAQSIEIILAHRKNRLLLYISDDGSGKDKIVEGNGLANIKRRVGMLGGTCDYGFHFDGGFNIMIDFPAEIA